MEAKKLPDFCGKIAGLFLFITWIKVDFTYCHDHSVLNNTSVLNNISVCCQTTDGRLNSGQLKYHIFITAINIPTHHRHLHHHMCTLQTSAAHRSHVRRRWPPLACFNALQQQLPPRSAAAAEAVHRITGGCSTVQQCRAGAAAQRRSGGRHIVAQHAAIFSMLPQFAAQRLGDLKKYMGRAGPGEGQGEMGGAGREGEGQLLNRIVVEALAGEREPEIECNLEFWTPNQ